MSIVLKGSRHVRCPDHCGARRPSSPLLPAPAPVTPYAPAPGAPVELFAQLRASDRADRWVLAFEREWTAALEESGKTSSLAELYEVVMSGRPASLPPRRSTCSSPPAVTRPASWTWRRSRAGTGDRTAAVRGPVVASGCEGARRAAGA
ncbi:DUF6247 family protein [Streptomyces coeruleofuscus]|uniref:DUF6247 family protein n=1 Tax=Streptomyces coeruleofuscus TaxID=66879 RepID=UPI0031F8151F